MASGLLSYSEKISSSRNTSSPSQSIIMNDFPNARVIIILSFLSVECGINLIQKEIDRLVSLKIGSPVAALPDFN